MADVLATGRGLRDQEIVIEQIGLGGFKIDLDGFDLGDPVEQNPNRYVKPCMQVG